MADFEKKKQDNKTNNPTDKTNSAKSDSNLTDKIGSAAEGDTKAVKDISNQAKDIAGKAYDIATEKAVSKIDEQKTNLAQGLSGVADTIRQLGDNLGDAKQPNGIAEVAVSYSNTVADKVEQLSGYFEKKDLREVMRDVEDFAHRQPLLFLGGAFALGILAARFLKSSNPNQALMRRPQNARKNYRASERGSVDLPENLNEQIKSKNNQADSGDNLSARAAK